MEDYFIKKINSLELNTPQLIYCEEILLENIKTLLKGLRDGHNDKIKAFYALKSCYNNSVLKTIQKNHIGIEVMTKMEYDLAISNGFIAENILVNGLGRDPHFLEHSILNGSRVIIDSENDLKKIIEIAKNFKERTFHFGIRISFEINNDKSYIFQNLEHKLGFEAESADLNKLLKDTELFPNIKIDMLHVHPAINQKSSKIHTDSIKILTKIVHKIELNHPHIYFNIIDIGGGYGSYGIDELPLAYENFLAISKTFHELFPERILYVEPGRYLSNSPGFILTKVIDVKQKNNKFFIITDATTNVLIPIPTARYELKYPTPITQDKKNSYKVSIVDGITSPDNFIIKECFLEKIPQIGDKIIIGNCGAYTDVLGHFWAYEPTPVCFLESNGNIAISKSNETIQECRKLLLGI
jgi:diaminopimelate decarboxylase